MMTLEPIGTNLGRHSIEEVILDGIIPLLILVFFGIAGIMVSKKTSKKTYRTTVVFYCVLLIAYIVTTVLKGYKMLNMPPHNMLKDLCSMEYDIIGLFCVLFIPLIYTIILLAGWRDLKDKEKKQKIKENKDEL